VKNLDTWCAKFPRNQLPLYQLSVVILEENFLILKEFLPDHIHEQNTKEYANLLIFQEFLTQFCKSKTHKHMQEGHGTWEKKLKLRAKWPSINHMRFLRLWAFWTFNWFSCPIFDPMSWRCLASVLSISMHKCRVRAQSGVLSLK
jgi:hypothetical protein